MQKIRNFQRNRCYRRAARKLYGEIIDTLKKEGATPTKVLYEKYKKNYKPHDYERIWKDVSSS